MSSINGPLAQMWEQFPGKKFASCGGCTQCCALGLMSFSPSELVTSVITFPRHLPLFKQGEEARNLYIVCSGYMKLSVDCDRGHKMVIQVMGPGSVLGLSSAFFPGGFDVSAESITNCTLKAVDRSVFREFLNSHPAVQAKALKSLGQTYDLALEAAARFGGISTAAKRLGKLLLDLGQQVGQNGQGEEVIFPLLLTQEELGSMVGLTRETVTRTLTQFRKEGWISFDECWMTIHYPQNLRNPDVSQSNRRNVTPFIQQKPCSHAHAIPWGSVEIRGSH
jgi:CRP/FNR family cyclic AMP-dependent transcriptional regulator